MEGRKRGREEGTIYKAITQNLPLRFDFLVIASFDATIKIKFTVYHVYHVYHVQCCLLVGK